MTSLWEQGKEIEIIIKCNEQVGGGGDGDGEAGGKGKAFEAKCPTVATICGWPKSLQSLQICYKLH